MKLHDSEIVAINYDGAGTDADGDPYPTYYVKVRTPWLHTSQAPDPVSDWIPVQLGWMHSPQFTSRHPLFEGMQVQVLVTDPVPGLAPPRMVVVGYGPNDDSYYEDKRQTVLYGTFDEGTEYKLVFAPEDPVEGPNEDYGLTLTLGKDFTLEVRLPYPNDSTRKTLFMDLGGMTTEIDMSSGTAKQTVTLGGVTYEADGIANTAKLTAGSTVVDVNGSGRTITLHGGGLAESLALWGGPAGLQMWFSTFIPALNMQFATKMDGAGVPGTFSVPSAGTMVVKGE